MLELFAGIAGSRWAVAGRSRYETRLGEVLIRLGRADEAQAHLERAIALDSTNTNARAWRAAAPPR